MVFIYEYMKVGDYDITNYNTIPLIYLKHQRLIYLSRMSLTYTIKPRIMIQRHSPNTSHPQEKAWYLQMI